jgi:hypothetical protein
MDDWTPRDADPATHHTLVDGVPQYMWSPLCDWFQSQYSYADRGRVIYKIERMQHYDLASRRKPLVELLRSHGAKGLFDRLDPDSILRIFDWTLYDNSKPPVYGGREANAKLESILSAGSSMWRVGTRKGLTGLERRVAEGVQQAADAAMDVPGDAGALLSEAWHATFGLSPDFEKGYAKSIKAVEAAAIPKVSSANTAATLGTVISQMRDQGNWKLEMTREHGTHTTQQVVLGMMQSLWTGQNDRHAGQPGYTPSTQAEAEAAVMLAVPLVQWFSSGAIARRP